MYQIFLTQLDLRNAPLDISGAFNYAKNNWKTIMLPIAPSKIDWKYPNRNETVELMNDGEINIPKMSGLTEISFEFMIPNKTYPFANNWNPLNKLPFVHSITTSSMEMLLHDLKADKKPFLFIVVRLVGTGATDIKTIGSLYNTGMKVTLEDYSIMEDAEEGQDLIISITLKEYKEYHTIKYENGKFTKQRAM